jgi:Protein of unknown function (DUF429)
MVPPPPGTGIHQPVMPMPKPMMELREDLYTRRSRRSLASFRRRTRSARHHCRVLGLGWPYPAYAAGGHAPLRRITGVGCSPARDPPTPSELNDDADRVGVDVPFGWPEAFVHAILSHHSGRSWPAVPLTALRFRETDRFVRDQVGQWPLSVSSEKIGVTAMRAAGLLSRLAARGEPVDRIGRGRWVEVYPAAALRRWGLSPIGYKGRSSAGCRRELLKDLVNRAGGWLRLP